MASVKLKKEYAYRHIASVKEHEIRIHLHRFPTDSHHLAQLNLTSENDRLYVKCDRAT